MLTLRPAEDDMPAEIGELSAHPLADLFPMMSESEHAALVADMAENGFREGCEIMLYEGRIIDGRNRYKAAREAGVTPRLANFHPSRDGDPLRYVIARNLNRRHLNETQRAWVASQIANLPVGRRAKSAPENSANLQNKKETEPEPSGETALEPSENLPKVAQAEAAKLFNVSTRSVSDAAKVARSGIEELNAAVRAGHLSISAAAKAAMLPAEMQLRIAEEAMAGKANVVRKVIKQEGRAARERDLALRQCALPDRRYGLILCDDEWDHQVWSRETGMDRHAANHYETAAEAHTAEEIHERTKDRFACAADDCVLAMWTTVQHLAIAIDLMRLRGFRYVSHYAWGKDKAGLGYWSRNKHEILLIGVRGKIPCPAPGTQRDSLIAAPVGAHSAKPECFAEMLEEYFPNLPKIELNRRGPARPGWAAWGNEAEAEATADAGEVAA